jgi:ER-bound oxygenase mpaB/B'/Rubber oxygenase, catalytic domain
MVRLFEEFEKDPRGLIRISFERSAFLFRRCGPAVFSFQGVGTLLAYTENPIVQPLSMTGKYAGDAALNRFMETARFWIDVSDPGGTRPGAPGRATAMRVRIMHVFLRHRITRHPQWNLAAWGKPISQAEATITLTASGYGTGLGMDKLGYRSTTPTPKR